MEIFTFLLPAPFLSGAKRQGAVALTGPIVGSLLGFATLLGAIVFALHVRKTGNVPITGAGEFSVLTLHTDRPANKSVTLFKNMRERN